MATHTLTIDLRNRVVLHVYEGVVTIDVVRAAMEAQFNDPDFDPSFAIVSDFRRATIDAKLRDVEVFSSEHNARFGGARGKTALLVDAPRETALTLMFQQRAQSREVQVFSTVTALTRWLGLSAPPANLEP